METLTDIALLMLLMFVAMLAIGLVAYVGKMIIDIFKDLKG